MQTTHVSEYSYHTWRDIGGAIGLVLDGIFCAFVLAAAMFVLIVGTGFLTLYYMARPILNLMSRSNTPKAD